MEAKQSDCCSLVNTPTSFTVAAAKFVKLRLQLPNLKLEWYSTELCWPRLDSMRAEIQQIIGLFASTWCHRT